MSASIDKLKKKAAEFEQKKQFDKALEVYLQIISNSEGQEDSDVTVYNRVGDLYLRLNKADQAVNYYEQAVDLYTDGGYLNNAIALCNKILRHAPARHQIYYKLGKISAKKGFNSDAKKNFLEYADRMHRAGRDTDAFKALQEFADLCPGQDDIRLMLADQLAKAGKKTEAIEQLQILHESLDAEGRAAEAEATIQRIQSLDPSVEPRRSKAPRQQEAGGLVFLDVGGSPTKPRPKLEHVQREPVPVPESRPRPRTPPHVKPSPEFEQLPDIEQLPDLEPLPDLELQDANSQVPGLEIQAGSSITEIEPAFDLSLDEEVVPPLEGLESSADPDAFVIDPEVEEVPAAQAVEGLISSEPSLLEPGLGEPLITQDPLSGLNVLEDDRFYIHDADPLAGLGQHHDEPVAESASVEPEAEVEAQATELDDIGLDEPDAAEEEIEEAPAARTISRGTPPRPEPPREEEEEEEAEVEDVPPQKVARRTPPHEEPEHEKEHEVPRRAEQRAPEQLKQSKLKVVPVRPTRPKPQVEKEPEPEPQVPAQNDKRAINPFQRKKPRDPSPPATPRVTTPVAEVPRAATPKQNAPHPSRDDNLVDLADWLREDSSPKSYRMVAADDKRVGDEQADFTDMLEKFKAGVAANVDDEDFDSHYDLGIAYREMGLIDEAIAEFQKALRGATNRIRAYEALGQCFIDGHQYDVAISILGRALREPGMEDEDLIGVLYLLGYASEEGKKARDAAAYYHRVFAIDMHFRDVGKRLKQMSKAASK
ncbi:MAG TPA: tetratricopeptide repeat protein [Gemmatimonadaceae bacterium]|jgi:tetratricopeptide (TPR) repeat protein|nr:tetratricopeptide repeat protein [Gemmatimonadaceae bacterium]